MKKHNTVLIHRELVIQKYLDCFIVSAWVVAVCFEMSNSTDDRSNWNGS